MWRLMRDIAGYSIPYEQSGSEDTSKLHLDPIRCAGQFDIKRAQTEATGVPALSFTKPAFQFCTDDVFFASLLRPSFPEKVNRRYTAAKWAAHLHMLVCFLIIIPVAWDDVKYASPYFAVRKDVIQREPFLTVVHYPGIFRFRHQCTFHIFRSFWKRSLRIVEPNTCWWGIYDTGFTRFHLRNRFRSLCALEGRTLGIDGAPFRWV